MENIIIGKHALESLTIGMYADPFVIFREYIQNSADSIDEAVNKKILNYGEDKIEVCLSPMERKIVIKDNGVGVPSSEVVKTLISVGNSKKVQGRARGFRGIGRLAALSYCGKLIFETSFYQEKKGTRIIFNARKLSEELLMEEGNDVSAQEVLEKIYSVETFPEHEKNHYFNVIMEELDEDSELDDYNAVYEYLSQNAPVTYNLKKFSWGKEIKKRIKNIGYNIPEYNIFLVYAGISRPIYKPYLDIFPIDKTGSSMEAVKDVEMLQFANMNGNVSTFGWVANTDYMGSIHDKSIKGIRIRKGNILIGDGQTVNACFKDARFNGWTMGELFVVDQQLIPNARRDNFEKNAAYFILMEQLKSVAASITRKIRVASMARNSELPKVMGNNEERKEGVSESENSENLGLGKEKELKKRLTDLQMVLDTSFTSSSSINLCKKEIDFEEIDMLIGKIQGITGYKVLNSIQSISKVEKKVLEKVFDVIVSVEPDKSEMLIDSILKVFV